VKHYLEYIVLTAVSKLLSLLGLKVARKFATFFAFVFTRILPLRLNTVRQNLEMAFPGNTTAWYEEKTTQCYTDISKTMIEMMILHTVTEEQIMDSITISNESLSVLKNAYERGKGVLLLSAHFGNWELGVQALSLLMKTGISVVVKEQSNKRLSDRMNSRRTRFGNRPIKLGSSLKEVYVGLKKGQIVAIIGDQRGSREGERYQFFGRETAFYNGAGAFCVKSGSAAVFAVARREKDDNFVLEITEINTDALVGEYDDKVHNFTQKYISLVEDAIGKSPTQWFWMHNIWKY